MEKKKPNAVEWAMRYHRIVLLVTTCLIAFGIYALARMNKNEFPDFTIRQGIVAAVYPGATAEQVEEQLTKPLEDYIFTYKEVKKAKTRSFSRSGMSIIQVELNDDLDDKDLFWSKFKHGINQFKASLPGGVLAVVVNDDFGDTSALLITMESNDKTYRELHDYMTALKDSLRKVESVGRMTVLGEQQEQVAVYLDADRLQQYGLSEQTIALSLLAKDFLTTAGTLRTPQRDEPIYVSRSLNAVHDVEQMIVMSLPTGQVVRLRDVATVRLEYPEPASFVTNNGRKCLVLSVEMKKGKNITELGRDVERKMDAFQQTLPRDVSLFRITDQPQVVNASVWNFLKELLIAIVAVIVVVLLLMPWRVALVASSTIPITIFISLGLFHAFGIELNTVTLAALIVTLGMIVDNSIVIIDSYVEQLSEGRDPWQASVSSATQFFRSILSATLAISVTFFPFLITLKGTFHDFILLFPWAISLVLFVSLMVAEMVVPFLQYWLIKPSQTSQTSSAETSSPETSAEKTKVAPSGAERGALALLQRHYDRLIDACFRHPAVTIATGVLSVVVGVWLLKSLPQRLMPTAERNQFAVEIYLPTGASLAETTALADSLEHLLRQDGRVVSVASFKGMASPRFQAGYAPQFAGPNYAQFIVNTRSDKATVEVLQEYRPRYENAFPGAYVKFKQLAYGTDENPVEVRLTGDDWPRLRQMADSVTALLRQRDDLRLVRNNVNEPLLATLVTLDPIQAGRMGVSNLGVETAMAVRYNSDGLAVGHLWEGDYDVAVSLKGTHANGATEQQVADEPMPAHGGLRSVPLRQVAQVAPQWYDGQIPHRNGLRCITVMAEVAQGMNATAVNQSVQRQLALMPMPGGISLTMGGEVESNAENMPMLVGALLVAIVIIFFILLTHFRSIATATLLIFSLSLCVLGTALGVFITGVDFSLTCFLGIISLMGILVRNAIIMFDYADELMERGASFRGAESEERGAAPPFCPVGATNVSAHKSNVAPTGAEGGASALHSSLLAPRHAVLHAAKRRMRPIFLTSAAASMGVIPMILGGSGLWMPMGAVICFGTLITMLFILTVLPVAYWLIKSRSSRPRS